MASFVEFLRTGHLGSLSCGMSQDQVRDLLGEPDAVFLKSIHESGNMAL